MITIHCKIIDKNSIHLLWSIQILKWEFKLEKFHWIPTKFDKWNKIWIYASLTGLSCSTAIKPMNEKITKPAKTLVALFTKHIVNACL